MKIRICMTVDGITYNSVISEVENEKELQKVVDTMFDLYAEDKDRVFTMETPEGHVIVPDSKRIVLAFERVDF